MLTNVSVVKIPQSTYPNKQGLFRPHIKYPEYLWDEIAGHENYAYEGVRQALYLMKLDIANYGTDKWNPFGQIVSQGDTVLIKPNMVLECNKSETGDERSLYTHPSIVAAVIDYVLIALGKNGRIIVGDAPVQECNFEKLIAESGYSDLISFYKGKGIDIDIVDFRELKSVVKNGMHVSTINDSARGTVIDLAHDSDFFGECKRNIKNMRITNYDPGIMQRHHNEEKHEYYISDYALQADVIINIPKPKCHRKAGMTAALKNFVGLNVRKEFLPHHTKGAKCNGGDEYDEGSVIHSLRSMFFDVKNTYEKRNNRPVVFFCRILIKLCSIALKLNKKQKYEEGSWYGNTTISRTVADINRIICYADKTGKMMKLKQRNIFVIGDMIISGEGEGPLLPTNKEIGVIVAGDNLIGIDKAVATIMGFDWNKIPTIVNAEKHREKYNLCDERTDPILASNVGVFNGKTAEEIAPSDTYQFKASSGWSKHVELR